MQSFADKVKDFWFSETQAQAIRRSRGSDFHLAEVLIDQEWYEYTEMITTG